MKLCTIALLLTAVAGIGVPAAFAQSKPVVLITEEEGRRAAPPNADLSFRAGVSRGPAITVLAPKPDDSSLRSPFRLQLKFEGRGGAQIDPDSLKLTYAKNPAVDLTPRVKAYVQAAGVDVAEAQVPPGVHTIRVEIKDKDGRTGSTTFTIKIAN
jgi:hypothetical protein